MIIEVWTDGSALSVPEDGDPGGWGVVLRTSDGRFYKELHGLVQHPEAAPTHNVMELEAAIQGLRAVKKPEAAEEVVLYTDSQVTIARCHKRAWRTPDPVFMLDDLHDEIKRIRRKVPLRFEHVPGHSKFEHNERAHELAYGEYKAAKDNAGVTPDQFADNLPPKIWGEHAIENVRRFQNPLARFYSFVTYKIEPDTPCRVSVGGKEAWLVQVIGGECCVVFKHLRKHNPRKKANGGWEYPPMYRAKPEEVIPI